MPPGILFLVGSLFVAESPRWLFRRGRKEQALQCAAAIANAASRPRIELEEMEQTALSTPTCLDRAQVR